MGIEDYRDIKKVLNGAACVLEKVGWVQGRLGSERLGGFCVIGAVRHTLGLSTDVPSEPMGIGENQA